MTRKEAKDSQRTNGDGLEKAVRSYVCLDEITTHETAPVVILISIGTGFPLLSVTGSILYTWSTDAAKMNKALLLKCLPGQILLS